MDIKALRAQYDCRIEIEKSLGMPNSKTAQTCVWRCPFHDERTIGGFHVYREGYYCFSCGARGDVLDFWAFWQKRSLAAVLQDHKVDPQEEMRLKAEYAKRATRELEEAIENAQKALVELRVAQKWTRYHDNLDDFARNWWTRRGVPEWYQDWAQLGYDPDHVLWSNNMEYHTPTMTIPIYEPITREVLNIRHRLLNPPEENDKYRPEHSGLSAQLFVADPDRPIKGATLVTEGEIKAAVSFITADDPNLQVVGLPGMTPREELFEQMKDCSPVYLCLDPDARKKPSPEKPSAQERAVQAIGKERVRLIELPAKIDDLIVENGLGKDWLQGLMRQARKV